MTPVDLTNAEIVNSLAALAAAISAIAACVAIRRSTRERTDERHLDFATSTLERAYATLTCEGDADLVLADRLAWLTTARLLEQYKAVKSRIKNKVALAECEGHEEHWRHQFHLALKPLGSASHADYFTKDQKHPVHPISAIIVLAFASWPDGKDDPIDSYKSAKEAIDKLGVQKWWIPLRRYLDIL